VGSCTNIRGQTGRTTSVGALCLLVTIYIHIYIYIYICSHYLVRLFCLFFSNRHPRWDEWLSFDSQRVVHVHTYTRSLLCQHACCIDSSSPQIPELLLGRYRRTFDAMIEIGYEFTNILDAFDKME
jgi:hypothetical protein